MAGVFNKVSEISTLVTSFSFIDDFSFIASSSSVQEIVEALKKVAKIVIEWGRQNAVIYNISKTKLYFFLDPIGNVLTNNFEKKRSKLVLKRSYLTRKLRNGWVSG